MRSFDCPTCGQVLNITSRKEGDIVKCEFCKTPAKVVRLGAPESTASPSIPAPPPPGSPDPALGLASEPAVKFEPAEPKPAQQPEETRGRRDRIEPEPMVDAADLSARRLLLILYELRTIKALLIAIVVGLAFWCLLWMSHQSDVEDLLRAIRVIRIPAVRY